MNTRDIARIHAACMEDLTSFTECTDPDHGACCIVTGPVDVLNGCHVSIGKTYAEAEYAARATVRDYALNHIDDDLRRIA